MVQDNSSAQKDIEPFAAYVKRKGIDIRSKNALLRAVDSFYYEQKSYRNSTPLKTMVSNLYDTDSFAKLISVPSVPTNDKPKVAAGMDYQSAVAALGTFPKDRVPRLNDLIQPVKKATAPNYLEELTVKNKAISDAADQTAKALVAKIRNGEFTSAMLESLKNPAVKAKVDALLGRTIGNTQGTIKEDDVKSRLALQPKFNDVHLDLASHTNKVGYLGKTGLEAIASTPAPKLTTQGELNKSLSDPSLDRQKNGEVDEMDSEIMNEKIAQAKKQTDDAIATFELMNNADKMRHDDPNVPVDVIMLDKLPVSPTLVLTKKQKAMLNRMGPVSRAFWTKGLPALGGKSRIEVYQFPYDANTNKTYVSDNFGAGRPQKNPDRSHAGIDIYPDAKENPKEDVKVNAVIGGKVLYVRDHFVEGYPKTC